MNVSHCHAKITPPDEFNPGLPLQGPCVPQLEEGSELRREAVHEEGQEGGLPGGCTGPDGRQIPVSSKIQL